MQQQFDKDQENELLIPLSIEILKQIDIIADENGEQILDRKTLKVIKRVKTHRT